MLKKNRTPESEKETSLARATPSPFTWFDEMEGWFDSLRRNFEERFWGGPLARWADTDGRIRSPPVDLIDEGSEFVVRAELPGVSKEDVDLTVTPEGVEIRAETTHSREGQDRNYHYSERSYRAFQRALTFPEEVKADLASASLKDGLLEVRIPKTEPTPERKPVKVPVD